jgi:hypothetical protein
MNVKKSFESRIRGWLPKEPYNPYNGLTGRALSKVRFSTATKFRIAARIVIAAIFFPLLAVAIFSNLQPIIHTVSIFSFVLTMFVLILIADTIAKKKYKQKTPSEIERF